MDFNKQTFTQDSSVPEIPLPENSLIRKHNFYIDPAAIKDRLQSIYKNTIPFTQEYLNSVIGNLRNSKLDFINELDQFESFLLKIAPRIIINPLSIKEYVEEEILYRIDKLKNESDEGFIKRTQELRDDLDEVLWLISNAENLSQFPMDIYIQIARLSAMFPVVELWLITGIEARKIVSMRIKSIK
ncbi:MAG: hypothetical protein ABIM99_05925 [Candidatus Dojkabacteria bacterium]